jgi:exocyst complex component 4
VEIVLFTIRTDVRCRVFHYLQRGLREVGLSHPALPHRSCWSSLCQDLYHIDQEAQDPDLYVAELNAELATCDNAISTTLGDRERR